MTNSHHNTTKYDKWCSCKSKFFCSKKCCHSNIFPCHKFTINFNYNSFT